MFCWQCGAEIPEGQNVCPKCYAVVRKPGILRRLWDRLPGKRVSPTGPGGTRVAHGRIEVTHRTQTVRVVDETTGEQRVYHSLEEAPPEIRARIQSLLSGTPAGQVRRTFTFRDTSGQERTYHSVDDMPPELRAVYERTRREHGFE